MSDIENKAGVMKVEGEKSKGKDVVEIIDAVTFAYHFTGESPQIKFHVAKATELGFKNSIGEPKYEIVANSDGFVNFDIDCKYHEHRQIYQELLGIRERLLQIAQETLQKKRDGLIP